MPSSAQIRRPEGTHQPTRACGDTRHRLELDVLSEFLTAVPGERATSSSGIVTIFDAIASRVASAPWPSIRAHVLADGTGA